MARETVDRSIQKRKEDAAKRRQKELDEAYDWVCSDQKGRLFLYDLIFRRCGLMDVYNAVDKGIFIHEGRRSIGQELAAEYQKNRPDNYLSMIAERQRDQRLLNEQDAAETGDDNA